MAIAGIARKCENSAQGDIVSRALMSLPPTVVQPMRTIANIGIVVFIVLTSVDLPPNAAHQRHGKVARILRFAKCVTL
jgi:hypothetical protein